MKKFKDYRDYVGPAERYPVVGPAYCDMMDRLFPGTWDVGPLLEVGCGGLRIGKELMHRLPKSHYYGIEPFFQVVEDALRQEYEGKLKEMFDPQLSPTDQFDIASFGIHFPVIISYAVFIHCGRLQLDQFLFNIRQHVDSYKLTTVLVLDLLSEDVPREIYPKDGATTAYLHASHNLLSYSASEVPGILRRFGGVLKGIDYPACDCEPLKGGPRKQHIIVFEP
jgi:hypothetical protein